MAPGKYIGQVFTEKVEICEGESTFENCVTLRIDAGAHGAFNNCKIDYTKCAAAIMTEASGDFENCSFRCSGDAAAGLSALPVYFDANNKERTRFVNNTLNGERL